MKKTIKLAALFLVICITGMFLMACMPSSVDAAKDKMTKAGYSVEDYQVNGDGVVGGIYAFKSSGSVFTGDLTTSAINAVLYETEEDAVDAVNASIFSNPTRNGKWLYWGDEEAIEAFTK